MSTQSKTKRNMLICEQFSRGKTQAQLAKEFHVTGARIWQILTHAGVMHLARQPAARREQKVFSGVLLDAAMKAAVIKRASLEHRSISSLIAQFIEEGLDRRRDS